MRENGSVTHRQQLELLTTALIPAAVGLLGHWIGRGGRLSWLLPLAVLPIGLILAGAWRRLGTEGLPGAIDQCCGPVGAALLRTVYLFWGLWLLAASALDCTDRLLATAQLPAGRWPLLCTALLLTLWLGRSPGRYVRSGRIFYLITAVTLGAVGLLALPSLRWENLLPLEGEPAGILLGGAEVLSLAGYGVYGLCQPVRGEVRGRRGWVAAEAAVLSALLLVVTGALGPVLAAKLDQPFLYILKGIGVPGAFQRGEAILAAVLALADLVLLGLLVQGCAALLPGWKWRRYGVIGMAAAAAAVMGSERKTGLCGGEYQIWLGVILGIVVPVFLAWKRNGCRMKTDHTISCG